MALAAGVGLVANAIGRAKPIWTETLCDTSIATVLGSQLREERGARSTCGWPGVQATAYRVAWSKDLAQQIRTRSTRAMGQGGSGTLLFERSLETREPKVYPLPQQALRPSHRGRRRRSCRSSRREPCMTKHGTWAAAGQAKLRAEDVRYRVPQGRPGARGTPRGSIG